MDRESKKEKNARRRPDFDNVRLALPKVSPLAHSITPTSPPTSYFFFNVCKINLVSQKPHPHHRKTCAVCRPTASETYSHLATPLPLNPARSANQSRTKQYSTDCLWSDQRQKHPPRLPGPCSSSPTKISATERPFTSSTLDLLLPLLKSPKQPELFLLDLHFDNHVPEFHPSHQLPHRTSSKALPLTEGESRKPRQVTTGSACYCFRPP